MPFSFEAIVICLTALGTDIWFRLFLRCTNVFSAVFAIWCAVICAGTMFLYLARWFALP